jgi:TatD DNase family protein
MTPQKITLADSHAHLTDARFESDLGAVVERAREAGVEYVLTIGTSAEDSRRCVEIASRYPGIFASAGIQPHSAHLIDSGEIDSLADIARADKIIGIGETGLEYHYHPDQAEVQKELTRACIRIARAVQKPVIYHCRKADGDMLDLLEAEKAWEVGGVMHCFSGSKAMADRCLEMGFYLSFAGPVTFPDAKKLRTIAREAPLDRILVETDAPYLAPIPFRGRRNEPAYVAHTAARLAECRGIPPAEMARAATENFLRLFKGNIS